MHNKYALQGRKCGYKQGQFRHRWGIILMFLINIVYLFWHDEKWHYKHERSGIFEARRFVITIYFEMCLYQSISHCSNCMLNVKKLIELQKIAIYCLDVKIFCSLRCAHKHLTHAKAGTCNISIIRNSKILFLCSSHLTAKAWARCSGAVFHTQIFDSKTGSNIWSMLSQQIQSVNFQK